LGCERDTAVCGRGQNRNSWKGKVQEGFPVREDESKDSENMDKGVGDGKEEGRTARMVATE
jgi:hypothetical protein